MTTTYKALVLCELTAARERPIDFEMIAKRHDFTVLTGGWWLQTTGEDFEEIEWKVKRLLADLRIMHFPVRSHELTKVVREVHVGQTI